MSRYRIVGSAAECQPGSNGRVLSNLLSVTDPASQGRLATKMLSAWHARWLGNVYAWAGAERTVNVSKDGFAFATAAFIPDLLSEFQQQQLDVLTPCKPNSIDELLEALSAVRVVAKRLGVSASTFQRRLAGVTPLPKGIGKPPGRPASGTAPPAPWACRVHGKGPSHS